MCASCPVLGESPWARAGGCRKFQRGNLAYWHPTPLSDKTSSVPPVLIYRSIEVSETPTASEVKKISLQWSCSQARACWAPVSSVQPLTGKRFTWHRSYQLRSHCQRPLPTRFSSTKVTSLNGVVGATRLPKRKVEVFTADFTFRSNISHLPHHLPGDVCPISQSVHMLPVAT